MPANTTTSTTQNQIGSAPFSSTTTPANVAFPNAAVGALNQSINTENTASPYADRGDPALNIPAGNPYTAVPQTWVNQGLNQNIDWANTLRDSGAATSPYFTALDRYNNPIDQPTQGMLNQYQNIYQGYQTPLSNLTPLAANTSGALTDTQQQIISDNTARLGNQLASQYSGSGRYGSAGAGIGLARGIAETNNPLMAQFNQANIGNALQANSLYGNMLGGQGAAVGGAGNLYNTAQARAGQYGQMLPGFAQLGLMPGQVQREAGQYMLDYPWQQLSNSVRAIQGLSPSVGTSTSGFQPINMGGTTTNVQPTPWTTYAGLGLAGAGLLCDRRLKMDIEFAEVDPETGLNNYTFHYKWQRQDEPKVIGPMADEVMLKYPDRVVSIGGILHVRP